ncbi:MAG: ABC transporter permease [Candidatus Cryosericum sp.]|nr:ABC transporter permease [Candidatus Cryosericum sp.]HPS69697.1 ABC transporter permease [Candidatus Cryosericum sp.]
MSENSGTNKFLRIFGIDSQGRKRRDPLNVWVPLISIALALVVGMIVIAVSGRNPFRAYALLFGDSGLIPGGSAWPREFAELLIKSAMYIATGLAIALAFKGGLFNIGAEGQFWVGAIVATFFGYWSPVAGAFGNMATALGSMAWIAQLLHGAICIILGMLAGGAWAAFAGFLYVKRGVNIVIGTIMLNWIAWFLITNWLVTGPMTPPTQTFTSGTYYVADTAKLFRIMMPTRLNTSIILVLLAAYATWFLLYKTTIGYEIRAIGHTANIGMEAPRAQGINVNRRIVQMMFFSGCLAAMGGCFFILGMQYQFPNTATMGYGWTGIGVALIGQSEPIGVVLAGLFIGALRTGATSMQVANIPKTFSNIIEGLAVGFIALQVAVRYYLVKFLQRRRAHADPPAEQEAAA